MSKGEKYTADQIKNLLGKYGTVYFPIEIKEEIDDIIGNEFKKERLDDFFKALLNYNKLSEVLKKSKLIPSLTVLLFGPPGTGKTSLTRAYAKKYSIPICVVDSDRLVSPLLGDTIKNIRSVVELSSDIAQNFGAFILFFDEIDAIGSERSNIHEVGEIKRAVISFLQVIDKIAYEGSPLAVFGATNHQHQLDSAIWRRFTFHLEFDFPSFDLRKKIIESCLKKLKVGGITVDKELFFDLDNEYQDILELSNELGSVKNEFENPILYEKINEKTITGLITLTYGFSGSDIERGTRVALFKAIANKNELTYATYYESLKLVGGTAKHVSQQEILSSSEEGTQNQKLLNTEIKLSDNDSGFIKDILNLTTILEEIKESKKELISDLKFKVGKNEELKKFIKTLNEIINFYKSIRKEQT